MALPTEGSTSHADHHQPGGPDELVLTPFMAALATALAGTGLDASGDQLVVDPASMAGHGLDANGDLLDVDETEFTYSILATALAGYGLDPNSAVLDVDEAELDHALIGGTDPAIAKTLLTTRGDLIRRGASAPERVALGTTGYALTSNGTDAVWAQISAAGIANDAVGAAAIDDTVIGPLGAWTAFTPTLSGGWALGNSTYVASYMRIGRLIVFSAVITLGTTATKGTTMIAALPVTAASAEGIVGINAQFNDVGFVEWNARVMATTTTTIRLNCEIVVSLASYGWQYGVTATIPATWATGDMIRYGGMYQAAS